MSRLFSCGLCCSIMSLWAIVQLSIMGFFYYAEAVVLLEDTEAHEYDDYDDFIKKTSENYRSVAINCWIASVLYCFTLVLSYVCIVKARKQEKIDALKSEDIEYICTPKPPKKKKPKDIK